MDEERRNIDDSEARSSFNNMADQNNKWLLPTANNVENTGEALSNGAQSMNGAEGNESNELPRPKKTRKAYKRTRVRKPDDAPIRPLSAYNFFFKEQRQVILNERNQQHLQQSQYNNSDNDIPQDDAKVSFEKMGKVIGMRWKNIAPEELSRYKAMASRDVERYNSEMETYREKYDEVDRQKRRALLDRKRPTTLPPRPSQQSSATTANTSNGAVAAQQEQGADTSAEGNKKPLAISSSNKPKAGKEPQIKQSHNGSLSSEYFQYPQSHTDQSNLEMGSSYTQGNYSKKARTKEVKSPSEVNTQDSQVTSSFEQRGGFFQSSAGMMTSAMQVTNQSSGSENNQYETSTNNVQRFQNPNGFTVSQRFDHQGASSSSNPSDATFGTTVPPFWPNFNAGTQMLSNLGPDPIAPATLPFLSSQTPARIHSTNFTTKVPGNNTTSQASNNEAKSLQNSFALQQLMPTQETSKNIAASSSWNPHSMVAKSASTNLGNDPSLSEQRTSLPSSFTPNNQFHCFGSFGTSYVDQQLKKDASKLMKSEHERQQLNQDLPFFDVRMNKLNYGGHVENLQRDRTPPYQDRDNIFSSLANFSMNDTYSSSRAVPTQEEGATSLSQQEMNQQSTDRFPRDIRESETGRLFASSGYNSDGQMENKDKTDGFSMPTISHFGMHMPTSTMAGQQNSFAMNSETLAQMTRPSSSNNSRISSDVGAHGTNRYDNTK